MTTPHKATPEQWEQLQACTAIYPGAWGDCILELRDRIAALEAGATCPHFITSDEGTSYCGLAEHGNSSAGLTGSPAPAGGLVERVMAEGYGKTHARAAILAVAEWFDAIGYGATASLLRQEAQRHG